MSCKAEGLFNDPEVIAERLAFAKEAIQWPRQRLFLQIFSNEV
jgi:hypothetical protein